MPELDRSASGLYFVLNIAPARLSHRKKLLRQVPVKKIPGERKSKWQLLASGEGHKILLGEIKIPGGKVPLGIYRRLA